MGPGRPVRAFALLLVVLCAGSAAVLTLVCVTSFARREILFVQRQDRLTGPQVLADIEAQGGQPPANLRQLLGGRDGRTPSSVLRLDWFEINVGEGGIALEFQHLAVIDDDAGSAPGRTWHAAHFADGGAVYPDPFGALNRRKWGWRYFGGEYVRVRARPMSIDPNDAVYIAFVCPLPPIALALWMPPLVWYARRRRRRLVRGFPVEVDATTSARSGADTDRV